MRVPAALPGDWQVPASPYVEGYAIGGSWLVDADKAELVVMSRASCHTAADQPDLVEYCA
jgi:hypothetical protein